MKLHDSFKQQALVLAVLNLQVLLPEVDSIIIEDSDSVFSVAAFGVRCFSLTLLYMFVDIAHGHNQVHHNAVVSSRTVFLEEPVSGTFLKGCIVGATIFNNNRALKYDRYSKIQNINETSPTVSRAQTFLHAYANRGRETGGVPETSMSY